MRNVIILIFCLIFFLNSWAQRTNQSDLQDYYSKNGIGEITIDRCSNNKDWTAQISYFDMQRNVKDTILDNCKMETAQEKCKANK